MKINWNTWASVTAAICGLVTILIIPVAQSWINLKFENQRQAMEATAAGVYEKQVSHDADIAKIAAATGRLQEKAADTDLQVQHLKDVVENKQQNKTKQNYEN